MEVNGPQEGHTHCSLVSAINGFHCYHFISCSLKGKRNQNPNKNVTIDSTAIHPNCSVSKEQSLDALLRFPFNSKDQDRKDPQTAGLHELKSQFCCGTTTATITTTMMMVRGALDQLVHHQWTSTSWSMEAANSPRGRKSDFIPRSNTA